VDIYTRTVTTHSDAAKALNGAVEDLTGAEKDHIREVEAHYRDVPAPFGVEKSTHRRVLEDQLHAL
jgi:hypothetical protein